MARKLIIASLGTTELEVMRIIWDSQIPFFTIRELHEEVRTQRTKRGKTAAAYTTVQTVVERLTEKGLLTCIVGNGTPYPRHYMPAMTRDEYLDQTIRQLRIALGMELPEVH